jgi:hypothetical protein
LTLANLNGVSQSVPAPALAKLFEILKDNIRIIILNSSHSLHQAAAIGNVIDYTIGIDNFITDIASIDFAAAFYQALAHEQSVEKSFALGKNAIELNRRAGVEAPVLKVREGVDASEPFVEQLSVMRMDYVDDLQLALKHLAIGEASDAEIDTVLFAIKDGKIIIKPDAIPGEPGSPETDLRVTPHRSFINVEAETSAFHNVREQILPTPAGLVPPLPQFVFLGRDEALIDVRNKLGVKRETSPDHRLLVVRGWPGVGKTSLVGMIARDQDVRKKFPDGVLWASLYFGEENLQPTEQEHRLLSQMALWGRFLGTESLLRAPTLNEATAQLADLLTKKRCLLIVDDVWKQGHAVPFIQACGAQSSALVTTRLPQVGDDLTAGGGEVYRLLVLSEDHAFQLLRVLAEEIVDRHPEECRQLVRDLECLPLAIHVAAGQLKSEDKLGFSVVDLINGIHEGVEIVDGNAPLDRVENGSLPKLNALLSRSTSGLDEQTRECFAFLGALAPKPATFDLEAMSSVWGIADPKLIVRILVGHGLLEPVGKGLFQMHALLAQHARSLLT